MDESRRHITEHVINGGFPYSKKLSAHTSCVDALAFSGDGRWLASAGDDPHIFLWDFHQDDLSQPSWRFSRSKANVFALAFSATNSYLYSGDTRNVILQFDISTMSSPLSSYSTDAPDTSFHPHTDSIRSISCHPEQDHIFLSAAEDGRIIMHDCRADSRLTLAQSTLQHDAEFTGVQYHPTMAHIFATSDNRGEVCLRDTRMAFGPSSQRSRKGIVQTYVTTLSKRSVSHLSNPEVSSLAFDHKGMSHISITGRISPMEKETSCPSQCLIIFQPYMRSMTLTRLLYVADIIYRVAQLYLKESVRTQIAHGSFGGFGLDDDDYYTAGSDDFRAYVWKIPKMADLMESREVVDADEWTDAGNQNTIAFASALSQPRYIPMELPTPLCRMTGHESIVNTSLIHPHYPYIVTAGIERDIVPPYPTSSSPCAQSLSLTPQDVRALPVTDPNYNTIFMEAMGLTSHTEDGNDSSTIALFDEILRQEGEVDVFTFRQWTPKDDPESSDMEEDTTSGRPP
ncbi:DDB1- and CUL4-associated factor 5 [Grifola frondosa]|uniref:DDB1-and CUL4-associated factor 5 n=1 Tax=Grifola frondosa TaxID=5627 RepID=A0A1C7M2L2_GRIFR|nr:DDB1- and CUL4-associated factor 5 [Grifola frondosa]